MRQFKAGKFLSTIAVSIALTACKSYNKEGSSTALSDPNIVDLSLDKLESQNTAFTSSDDPTLAFKAHYSALNMSKVQKVTAVMHMSLIASQQMLVKVTQPIDLQLAQSSAAQSGDMDLAMDTTSLQPGFYTLEACLESDRDPDALNNCQWLRFRKVADWEQVYIRTGVDLAISEAKIEVEAGKVVDLLNGVATFVVPVNQHHLPIALDFINHGNDISQDMKMTAAFYTFTQSMYTGNQSVTGPVDVGPGESFNQLAPANLMPSMANFGVPSPADAGAYTLEICLDSSNEITHLQDNCVWKRFQVGFFD
jgi:hypothetical protein